MFKKLFLFVMAVMVLVAFLGGIFSVNFSSFSLTINKPEKDFLKKVARKAKNIIYREATEHNLEGDFFPDQIDDKLKEEIRKKIN